VNHVDVIIIGAGPCGLTLANQLGAQGIEVVVLEERPELIDYPRGVGLDDESLRTFQSLGVIDGVMEYVVPDQKVIYVDSEGKELARMSPRIAPFGWPRRNGFIQPAVDAVLLANLPRYPSVSVRWGHAVSSLSQDDDSVTVSVDTPEGPLTLSTSYVVGCDGGRSMVRKHMGSTFEGISSSTRWLVVDLENDPVGVPNTIVGCDPARPYISIGLPGGIRRFEFMLKQGEGEEMSEPERVRSLIDRFIDPSVEIQLLRARVYTHHARVAGNFVDRRILIAGDAAHLMPVWQGQGYNTAIRDATNLWWKLSYVVKGLASPALLRSYDEERRPHATAMVRLSEMTGRFLSPTNVVTATTRNIVIRALSIIPRVKSYIMEARFKPMPTYTTGAIIEGPRSPIVGKLLIQPHVVLRSGDRVLLDEVTGPRLTVLQWASDPRQQFSERMRERLDALDARYVAITPQVYTAQTSGDLTSFVEAVDVDRGLRALFDEIDDTVIFVRPDRIVAATCQPQHAEQTAEAVLKAFQAVPQLKRVS
jgi:3-(3-hydroxy-phenyl)propionate hydroxylase